MRAWSMAASNIIVSVGVGCAGTKTEPVPTPAARTSQGPLPGGGARRGPPNFERQDSVRLATMEEVLRSVAGREDEPAGHVFKSVQLNKNMPVKQFLTMMSEQYGRGLGNTCTGCHQSAIVNGVNVIDYASDKPKDKRIARDMERMQQSINRDLAKNQKNHGIDDDYPKATCVMCHRGTAHMPNMMKPMKNSDPPPPTRAR